MFTVLAKKVSWVDPPVISNSGNTYYNSVELNDEVIIEPGDFVTLRSTNEGVSAQIVKVAYMWEDVSGIARFHANYLWRSRDTVLGETGNKKELFFINRCLDMTLAGAMKKVDVEFRKFPRNWSEKGDIIITK